MEPRIAPIVIVSSISPNPVHAIDRGRSAQNTASGCVWPHFRRCETFLFGKELPVVYRWAYDYSVPGAEDDYIPQDVPNEDVSLADGYSELGVEKT